MADLPSDQKPESGGTQDAKNEANSKKIQAEKEKIKPPKERPMRIRGILYEIFFWLFTAIAGFICVFTHTLAIVSIPLFWVGLIFAALWLRRSLLNNGSTKRFANRWCAGIWIPSTIISIYVFWAAYMPEPPTPPPVPVKPHLQLGLAIAGAKGFPLFLTNEVFKIPFKSNGLSLNEADFKGVVVVPVLPGTSNVTVGFMLNNNSGTEVADGAVKISIPTNAPCRLSPGWFESQLEDDPMRSFFVCPIVKIVPGEIKPAPTITFGTHGPSTVPISLMATAPQMDVLLWALRLHFMQMDSPGKPFVTIPTVTTNKDGTLNWQLGMEFESKTNWPGLRPPVLQGKGIGN